MNTTLDLEAQQVITDRLRSARSPRSNPLVPRPRRRHGLAGQLRKIADKIDN